MLLNMQNGFLSSQDEATGCQLKRNGNMQRGEGPLVVIFGAMILPKPVGTQTAPI
jgi:hypothetical protein